MIQIAKETHPQSVFGHSPTPGQTPVQARLAGEGEIKEEARFEVIAVFSLLCHFSRARECSDLRCDCCANGRCEHALGQVGTEESRILSSL